MLSRRSRATALSLPACCPATSPPRKVPPGEDLARRKPWRARADLSSETSGGSRDFGGVHAWIHTQRPPSGPAMRIDALPPLRPVSATDAALRSVINEFVVHVPCGGIRGPIGRLFARCDCPVNDGLWQSCPCEDEPVRWENCDVSRQVDLCLLCARGTAGGVTRWSWLGCGSCRSVNEAASRSLGYRAVPLGRHSIMNSVGVRVAAQGEEVRRGHDELVGMARTWGDLDAWFDVEVQRLAASQGWTGKQVQLRTWKDRLPSSRAASRSALRRFFGHRHEQ